MTERSLPKNLCNKNVPKTVKSTNKELLKLIVDKQDDNCKQLTEIRVNLAKLEQKLDDHITDALQDETKDHSRIVNQQSNIKWVIGTVTSLCLAVLGWIWSFLK